MRDKLFKIVCLGSFLTSFSYGVMLTLPMYLNEYLKFPITFSGEVISFGVIGVLLSIILIPFMSKFIKSSNLASLGALIYALAILFLLTGNKSIIYFSGLLLGAGWGVIYTLGPIIVSASSSQEMLSKNFMLISAFNMLGAGLSPVLVKILLKYNVAIVNIYLLACILAFTSSCVFYFINTNNAKVLIQKSIFFYLKKTLSTKAIIPSMMVLLGACIFSTMMNFQVTIAKHKLLDFSIFYVSYTVSILFSRFFLNKYILLIRRCYAIPLLIIMMTVSLILFIFTDNNLFYIIPSSLLGVSYGLVYPLIQTEMVANVPESDRGGYLTIFSLFYFIGVFGYPYFFTIFLKNNGFIISLYILIAICIFELFVSLFLLKRIKP